MRDTVPTTRTHAASLHGAPAGAASAWSHCAGVAACVLTLLLCASTSSRADDQQDDLADELDVRVTGIIDAPIEEVRAVLQDIDGLGGWFPAVGEWDVLERSADGALVHGRQVFPWLVRDRDYVVRYRWWTEAEGVFVLRATALQGAEPGATRGAVRIERMQTTWRIAAANGGTRTEYHYLGSSGLPLPDWLVRIGWESQTHRLIDALAAEVEGRREVRRPDQIH